LGGRRQIPLLCPQLFEPVSDDEREIHRIPPG
jgi:hypothetical protein